MAGIDFTKLKKELDALLKDKKLYEKTDTTLLDEMVYQVELLNAAKIEYQTKRDSS